MPSHLRSGINTLPGLSERRLRYFAAAVTAGSLRAAADSLDLEPSVLSRQIQQLETELGVVLLERRGRGVTPTEAAQLVLNCYRQHVVGEETLLTQLEELNGLQRGQIRIAATEGFLDELVSVVLNDFCLQYPKIDVTLELMSAGEVVRYVAEDRAHLGVAYAPQPDPSVRIFAARSQPVCVIAAPTHPLAARADPLTLRDVVLFPVGLTTPGFGLRRIVQLAEFSEKLQFRPGLTTNSIAALKHYASAGLGITFLPKFAVAREIAMGQLVALRTRNRVFEAADAQLLVRDKRPRSAAVDRMIAQLATMSGLRQDAAPKRSRVRPEASGRRPKQARPNNARG